MLDTRSLPDLETLDPAALKALIVAQHGELLSHKHEIEHLQLLIAKLRRMLFGRSSEKISRQIEQLELRLEELESARAEHTRNSTRTALPADSAPATYGRALPEHLPREVRTHLPEHDACPECGGQLRRLGEDVSEMLERIPATYMVIRHVRPKFSCGRCQHIVQAPAPSRPLERSIAGPALLANVVIAKFSDHLPLYRQAEIAARQGVELERSTLADWVGGISTLVQPLVQAIRQHVMTAEKLHADDTPVPVLAPGTGTTKTGRLWTYVRDDRPSGDTAAPAVWFAYSPDRKGEHPRQHLRAFRGTLQADGYAGFHHLYGDGHIQEAACWAHVRRKFHDLHVALASPLIGRSATDLTLDGLLSHRNNSAERALRAVALGRKNYLFAGSDSGGDRAAAMYTLIGTAKLNNLDPEAYLRILLQRIADHPIQRIHDLLPWNLSLTHS
jgi:transposase